MAEGATTVEGMEAALNASLERKTSFHEGRTNRERVLELGKSLQRLMVGLTSDVGALREELDEGEIDYPQCINAVNTLHDTKMALLKTYAEWHRVHGKEADVSVGNTVAKLEICTNKVIDAYKDKMDQLNPPQDVRKRSPLVKQSEIVTTVISDFPALTKTSKEVTISVKNDNPVSQKTLETMVTSTISSNYQEISNTGNLENIATPITCGISGGHKRVGKTATPTTDPISRKTIEKVTTSINNKSASLHEFEEKPGEQTTYGERLTALKPKKLASKKNSKGSKASKTSSKASKAASLQVRLEEAEAKIEEEYNREVSERALRHATRNAKREQERVAEEAKRNQEMILEKLADEKAEREARLNKKKASIKAKRNIIESFREENSIKSNSAKSEVESEIPEIQPLDKAAAYVVDVLKQKSTEKLKTKKDNLGVRVSGSRKDTQRANIPQTTKSFTINTLPNSHIYSTSEGGAFHRPNEMQASPIYTAPATNLHYTWATRTSQTEPTSVCIYEPEKLKSRQITRISTPSGREDTNLIELGQCEPSPLGHLEVQCSPLEQPYRRLAQSTPVDHGGTDRMIEAVRGEMSLGRLPVLEPEIFDGRDLLSFPIWRTAFEAMTRHRTITDIDKMNLLNRYVGGEAKVAIRGYLLMEPSEAFSKAYNLLVKRYGDNCKIANAFKDRLKNWAKIGGTDMDGLRVFVDFLKQCDTAKRNFRALRTLDDESQNAEICRKLPAWIIRKWTNKVSGHREATGEFPPFCEFVEFLTEEETMANDPLARVLRKSENSNEKTRGGSFASESRNLSNGSTFGKCAFCKGQHSIDICKKFEVETSEGKRQFIRETGLCFKCLLRGHISRHCRSRLSCQICQGGHPTSLHSEAMPSEKTFPSTSVTACASRLKKTPQKSSMVVPVYVSHTKDPNKEKLTYAMLDSQSDSTFMTDEMARALGLEGKEVRLSLSTMTASDKIVNCKRFSGLRVRGYDRVEHIDLPPAYSRKSIPANRRHIPCADMIEGWPYLEPLRNKLVPKLQCNVGLLIGYDCPRALIPNKTISGDKNGPFGQRTALGWGIVGVISDHETENSDVFGCSHRIAANPATGSQITIQRRCKEVTSPADCLRVLESDFSDRIGNEEGSSLEERTFLRTMEEGIEIDSSGHYSMPLPFNRKRNRLFNNKALVRDRAMSLKKKLAKNPEYHRNYTQFMEDMLERGFAEEVRDSREDTNPNVWYVPHFGVFHKTKGKLRVVFDCAARYGGVSLNDTLLKGPDYLNSLIGILCRFRKHPVAFCCDVEKMFYAFHVQPSDRDYLRYLWWEKGDITRPLSTYRMTAHVFGAISSPACASFGLRRIAEEFPEYGEDVLRFINNDFYVDDGLKSVLNDEEAISLVKRTIEVCGRRGVRLHKFTSNSDLLLKSIPDTECAVKTNTMDLSLDDYPVERILGVLWNIKEDCFQFRVKADKSPTTKREILSVTSGIFDPLGWISPFTLKAKIILQLLCRGKLDWDDKAPLPELRDWEAWYRGTRALHEINITRCIQSKGYTGRNEMQWHHFSDASETAYGACSYLRVVDDSGKVAVHLMMAKSRVAPIASMTIPRLELTAAVVAARLSVILERELGYAGVQHFFWTDSQIVLGYLHNEAKRFKIFVANRVQEIHDISNPSQWRHVPGQENPADLASRGISAENLLQRDLWFNGPSFLKQERLLLRDSEIDNDMTGDEELRRVTCQAASSHEDCGDIFNFDAFSSWRALVRGVARAKKIVSLFKNTLSIKTRLRSSGHKNALETLTVADMVEAEEIIIKAIQQQNYAEEIASIDLEKTVPKGSGLYRLSCFLDKKRVLRVGGRLKFTNLYSVDKYPIVLPKAGHASFLLIRDCHHSTHHQGRGMTINEVRSRGFWVIGLGGLVKSLIRSCVTCRAHRGKTSTQKMSDLPPDRAECEPPFTYCGMDVFGPFVVKERRSVIKRYGVIFTCLTTRAVHLEMAYSLSADAFIQTLRKFIAIRGPIRLLRCDNGTNFIGANRELSKSIEAIQAPELKNFALRNNCDIQFRMNPPSASHMGGAWERLIGVVRSVLNVILDQHGTRLDDSALSTFLYEVSAVVNSRPLSLEHITDAEHPEPLTPNHLLTGKSKVIVPPPGEFSESDAYSMKRWRCVQFLTDRFWLRWRKEYLQYLQLRSKWQRREREMRVGDVVLLSDVNAPRNDWRKGLITEVLVSKDGFVRTVRVKVGRKEDGAESILTRPVHKLVLLLPSAEHLGE